jgi:hypothetical protein
MAADEGLGLRKGAAGDGNLKVGLVKQIARVGAGYHAGAENDDVLHG